MAYDDAAALQPGGGVDEQYQLYTGPKLNGPINDPPDPLPLGEAVFLGNAPYVRVTVKSLADDFDQATIEVTFASDVMAPTAAIARCV